jgi:hypothetical protein
MPLVTDPPEDAGQPPGEMPGTDPPAGATVPATVLAASILLYVGGALTFVYALAGVRTGGLVRGLLPSSAYAAYGLLYVGLGWAVGRRRRWARRTVLVLCGIGVALALVRLVAGGFAAAVPGLAWPVVYAVLLSTDSARSWFRATPP